MGCGGSRNANVGALIERPLGAVGMHYRSYRLHTDSSLVNASGGHVSCFGKKHGKEPIQEGAFYKAGPVAVPEIFCSLFARKISTAATRSPPFPRHRRRSGRSPPVMFRPHPHPAGAQ